MSREQTITQYISTLLEKEGERGRFEKEAEKYKPKSGLMSNRNEPKKDEPVDTAPKVMSSADHLFNAVEEMSRYVDDSGSDAITDSISRSVRIPNVPTSLDRRTPLVDLYRLNMGGETEQGFLKAPAAPVAPSIDTKGKGKPSFAQSIINSLRSRYQEKRIIPSDNTRETGLDNVTIMDLPKQPEVTVSELDDAVIGGDTSGKVDEGLMSRPYDKEAMLDINEPQGVSNYIIQSLESPVVSGDSFSTETLTETLNSLTNNNNAFTAAVLGNVDMETGGEGLVEEELFYKLKNAKVKFRNAEDVLKTLPKEVQTRLKKGRDTSEDRGIFGTALADENYDGGSAYKGRGLVQLTHLRNYRAMQNSLAEKGIIVDLVNKPALANDPKYALPIALTYLESRGLTPENAKELGPYKMSRMINSGEPTNDKIKRWNAVMSEMTGTDLADARLSNEKTAQKKAGVTDVDGIIGDESERTFKEWLTNAGISFELSATPYDLVRLVNSN